MTTSELTYFKEVYNLFEKYYQINVKKNTDGFNSELCIEAKKRIMQLDYILSLLKKLDDEIVDINEKMSKRLKDWRDNLDLKDYENKEPPKELWMSDKERKISIENVFKIELNAESFYYLSFRLRNIIRYLPGLGKKFESKGVRNVRNLIIEHPEKSEIFENGFACGSKEYGPSLKSIRSSSNNLIRDKGLYLNAKEFRTNFEKILNNYFSKDKNIG